MLSRRSIGECVLQSYIVKTFNTEAFTNSFGQLKPSNLQIPENAKAGFHNLGKFIAGFS